MRTLTRLLDPLRGLDQRTLSEELAVEERRSSGSTTLRGASPAARTTAWSSWALVVMQSRP